MSATSVKSYLEQARAILASGRWIKGHMWDDGDDKGHTYSDCRRLVDDPHACFCSMGAAAAVTPQPSDYYDDSCQEVLSALFRAVNGDNLATFNDDPVTTLDDVLALYDRAIASCEEA
jgi:hypothetical protein